MVNMTMHQEYLEWVQTDEGKEYLKGGSKYRPMKWEEEADDDTRESAND